ncbi:unnamed protein product [Caretta caretta]
MDTPESKRIDIALLHFSPVNANRDAIGFDSCSLFQTGFQPSGYLEVHPKFHQSYPISAAGNIQAVGNPRQNYSAGQNPYAFIANEEGGVFGKGGATCSVQQTVGFIAQHKVDFYHGFPGTMEYTGAKTGDGYSFHHASATVAPFPGTAGHHLYHP